MSTHDTTTDTPARDAETRRRALAWADLDPDPVTAAAARRMLDDPSGRAAEELRSCFGERLAFGTAGIRGLLGPGPGRMNRALVRMVSAGVADYLARTVGGAKDRGVVIGHDGRTGSEVFAADAAAVFRGAGFRVIRCPRYSPTPLVAFALRQLSAACGVVVTASHNPPAYNGYKVYWENGAQIVPPIDAGIAAAIDVVMETGGEIPFDEEGVEDAPASLGAEYLHAIREQLFFVPGAVRAPSVVHTAMHGVAAPLCERALRAEGASVVAVAEQREPDPDFPTVAFPNPEEPGALDLADALAEAGRADLILANDPDGDRLSITVRWDGVLRRLTGDEVGILLGDALLDARGVERNLAERAFVARTVVSSELLSRIAEHHGAECLETLTGFKWLWNAALEREASGGRFVFAYEEALGYAVGPAVRDKDGIGAALLAARLEGSDRPSSARLAAIWERHGYYGTRLHSVTDAGAGGVARLNQRMKALRAEPPEAIGGLAVARHRDFSKGGGGLPASNLLAFWLEDGTRLMLRPSGTEPKLKIYLQVVLPWQPRVEARASERMSELVRDLEARLRGAA